MRYAEVFGVIQEEVREDFPEEATFEELKGKQRTAWGENEGILGQD